MRPNFRPLRGLVVFLFFFLLTLSICAADKKRKPAEPPSKTKSAITQKTDSKQQSKNAREAGKDRKDNKQQIAQKKKNDQDEKRNRQRGKEEHKLATRNREEKANAKTAKLEVEKKSEKKGNSLKEKTAQLRGDRKSNQKETPKEVVAKKSTQEKPPKSVTKPEAKNERSKTTASAKPAKQDSQHDTVARTEDDKNAKRDTSKAVAKNDSTSLTKPEARHQAKEEEKAKELPQVKFALRPVAKVIPKVELKFSVARALGNTAFDAPPPRDMGPDVIDVIEHDSSDAKRLDDLLRSEMKTMQFSGVPGNSRKKIDVGKMDEERIRQIQEVLVKKGYYNGEITGQYDDATIEAMRKFQEASKIDVTGYATAQSLRLLGLTDW